MQSTASSAVRVAVAALTALVVGVAGIELGRGLVDMLQPDREELLGVVELATPPGTELRNLGFSEGFGFGNLLRWLPPVADDASATIDGATVAEVQRRVLDLGWEPATYGTLHVYERGQAQLRVRDAGVRDGDVDVYARQDPAWWMFIPGPLGGVVGATAGWRLTRGHRGTT